MKNIQKLWKIAVAHDRTIYIDEGNFHVAKVCGSTATGDQRAIFKARAKVLAASPDMLSTLRKVSAIFERYSDSLGEQESQARNEIRAILSNVDEA